MRRIYVREFDTYEEAIPYAKNVEKSDIAMFRAIVLREVDMWIVEVWIYQLSY